MGEVAKKQEFNTYLANINNTYLPMIARQMESNEIEFTEYQKKCVLNALGAINQTLDAGNLKWNDQQLDQSNITQILFNVASLELNAVAEPRECYFQLRSVPVKDAKGSVVSWKKKIEMGIEGDGNDAILARFGRNVEKVYPYWVVRENDVFEFPKFNGLEMTPPKWEPRYTGNVVRVVYPILHKDKTLHFYIAEREDVKKNLLAHINNNMMNATFGICEDRKKATKDQLSKIAAKKKAIKEKACGMTLDAILKDDEFAEFISPSWKEDYSREEMLIRKMRNNIVKKIPKDFRNSATQESFMELTDDDYRKAKEDIIEHTATVLIEEKDICGDADATKIHSNGFEGRETRVDTDDGLNGDLEPLNPADRVKPSFD